MPVIAIVGIRAGNLLGGTVIIEALFDWPGLSSLLVSAAFARDYPVIQGSLLAIFAIFILISLAIDLAQGWSIPASAGRRHECPSVSVDAAPRRSPRWLSAALPAWLAAAFLLLVALAAAFGPMLGLQDPYQIDAANLLSSPTWKHWLGTDDLGRDLLSRAVHGARVSLTVAAAAVALAGVLGVAVGVGVAFLGRRAEAAAIRVVDVFVSLPEIFVALVVLAFIGGNLPTLVATIGILYAPQFARVAWGVARGIRAREHVQAARSLGAGPAWIIWHEVLPNMRSIIAVQASFTFSFAMLLEAGLSFLGLGVRPPVPSWGQMVGSLKDYLYTNPWPVLVPALALFFTVLAVNVLGDWLQDALNPELRR